jgi:spore coat protein U-like protein
MRKLSKLVAVAALLALAFGPGRALAATGVTATLPVQASVTSGCLIGTVGINFGAVSPLVVEEDLSTEPYESQGAIELACGTSGPTSGSGINVSLDNGANGAIAPILGIGTATQAIRAMTNGTSFLAYDLFKPDPSTGTSGAPMACTTQEWGAGASGPGSGLTITFATYAADLAAESPALILPVCGSIPSDQVQPLTPGIYTDTVTATVTF